MNTNEYKSNNVHIPNDQPSLICVRVTDYFEHILDWRECAEAEPHY